MAWNGADGMCGYSRIWNISLFFDHVTALVAFPIVLPVWATMIPVKEPVAAIGTFSWFSEDNEFSEKE
jgi:hypothetical protein